MTRPQVRRDEAGRLLPFAYSLVFASASVGLVLFFAGCRAVSRDRQEAESEWEARQREKSSSAVAKARRNVDTSEPTTVALVSKSEASETSARRDRSYFCSYGETS